MENIYAVIWLDFIPLSLPQPDPASAVRYAREMHARATQSDTGISGIRAVMLPADSDTLTTLWQPDDLAG